MKSELSRHKSGHTKTTWQLNLLRDWLTQINVEKIKVNQIYANQFLNSRIFITLYFNY